MIRSNQIYDTLLVLECQAGSRKAMNLLVKRWHLKLCRQAYWYTHDKDQAKDIAQDSWSVILSRIRFLNDPNRFGSWAMKIVTRKAIDWLRKQKKEPNKIETHYDISDSTTHGDDTMASDVILLELQNSIKKLPPKK